MVLYDSFVAEYRKKVGDPVIIDHKPLFPLLQNIPTANWKTTWVSFYRDAITCKFEHPYDAKQDIWLELHRDGFDDERGNWVELKSFCISVVRTFDKRLLDYYENVPLNKAQPILNLIFGDYDV